MDLKPNEKRFSRVNLSRFALAVLAAGLLLVGLINPAGDPAVAAAGINKTINYQGRLLNSAGAVVPDGNYNLRFKVYQDGDGCVPGGSVSSPCGGTIKWTEKWENQTGGGQGVVVKNGYFSVTLGTYCAFSGGSCQSNTNAGVNWNQDTLWLTMDVGGTTTGSPTYDGEMLPMRRMSSSVYALQADNANSLGGLTASQFIQNVSPAAAQQTANINILSGAATNVAAAQIQTVASATAPVLVLKGGATPGAGADLLQLQNSSATPLARIDSSGNLFVAASVDTQTATGLSIGNTNATSITLSANTTVAAGKTLTVTSAATSLTGATSGDALTVSNSTSTGNIAVFKDNSTAVATIADGGATTFRNSTDSGNAFQVQNASGSPILNIDSVNASVIPNGSFETTASGATPSGWAAKGGGSNTVQASTAQKVYGANSMWIHTTATAGDGAKYNTTLANATYTVSFEAKGSSSSSGFMYGYSSDGSTEALCSSGSNSLLTTWARYSCTFVVSGTSGTPYFFIKQTDTTSREIYIDGLQVEAGSGSIQYSEGNIYAGAAFANPFYVHVQTDTTSAFRVRGASGTTELSVDSVNHRVGIGVATPGTDLQFGGNSARTISVDQRGSDAAGMALTLQGGAGGSGSNANAGGNVVLQGGAGGGTNGNGGNVVLSPGTKNGSGANGSVLFSEAAGSNLQITAATASTADMVVISNSGQASTTSGVDGLAVTFGSSNASGDALHVVPSYTGGATDALTYNIFEADAFTATNAAGTDAVNGILLGNLTESGGINSTALKVGSGWDSVLSVNGVTVINGSGVTQVAGGGTGLSSANAYELLAGGTTSTGAFQSIGAGTAGYVLQSNGPGALPSWVGGAGCSTCVAQVPTTTAQNTITPTVNSVVGLTVNATSGTSAEALIVNQSKTSDSVQINTTNTTGTQTNGVIVNRNGSGGTTTNGINVTNTAGTLTNGLAFTGTIGTDINRSSGTLTLQGAGGISMSSSTGNISLASAVEISDSAYLNSAYGGLGPYGNLLTYSEDFSNAAWTKTSVTVTTNSQPAPNTQNDSDELASTSAGGTVVQTYTSGTTGTYTFSVWVKTLSGTQPFTLKIDSTGGTPTSGTASSYTANTTWQRYSVSQLFSGSPTNFKPTITITNNSATIVAWGAQLRLGSTPGVYISTGNANAAAANGLAVDGKALFRSDSTTAFQVQNSGGGTPLTVDTSNNLVTIVGSGTLNDAGTSSGGALQIGPSSGGNMVFDENEIMARNNGSAADLYLQNEGGNIYARPSTFNIQTASGADTILSTSLSSNRVNIGNATASSGSDTTLLVLDSATTANAPTGTNGGMFYDTTLGKFRCYQGGAYRDCLSDLQNAYDRSATASILLTDAKDFTVTAADTSTDPNILFNLQCTTSCSTNGRFAVQNGGSDVFLVNSNSGSIRVGSSSNNVTFASSTYEPTLNGNARHTRKVTLSAEYAGASLTADGSNNTGTMTTDNMAASPYRNFYKWTTTQGTAQDYDVWVRIPLPSDFAALPSGQTICVDTYASATTANGVALTLYGTNNSSVTLTDGDLTPSSTTTWQNQCTSDITAGTYAADGVMTLDLKLTAPATTGDIRIGDITFSYLSKW